VNSFSNFKKTPLHLAALNNNYECLKLLIEKDAYIESLTDEDCTPLHLASKKGNFECVQILLNSGANIYALDF